MGVAPGSFDSRKALPVPWRGLRDAELRCAAGWLAGWPLATRVAACLPACLPAVWVPDVARLATALTPTPTCPHRLPARLLCSAASGVPGGVFVHASGFIGGNATLEGAVEMAAKALDMD